ncbi:MAG: glucosamine-6-phosphate deaminase [Lachnospiraceae bacterium]|nr:glucosamine-6-phosphate deaminase [Lachnospiraceae bacterium]
MKTLTVDKLQVKIMPNRTEMGEVAAADIHAKIKELLAVKEEINIIFAAAPSQNDVLQSLVDSDIEWNRVNAFHMDEYIGLDKSAPQGFGNFLNEHIFGKAPFKSVNYIDCEAADPEQECERYAKLLEENPADIIIMGIGENGHIAFNDPWVADFKDTKKVKTVLLDEVCRQQQVNDGCFKELSQVPKQAITLTCPVFNEAPQLFCIVPAPTKAQAVKRTLCGAINEECPATILREHEAAVLYLDADSSALLG